MNFWKLDENLVFSVFEPQFSWKTKAARCNELNESFSSWHLFGKMLISSNVFGHLHEFIWTNTEHSFPQQNGDLWSRAYCQSNSHAFVVRFFLSTLPPSSSHPVKLVYLLFYLLPLFHSLSSYAHLKRRLFFPPRSCSAHPSARQNHHGYGKSTELRCFAAQNTMPLKLVGEKATDQNRAGSNKRMTDYSIIDKLDRNRISTSKKPEYAWAHADQKNGKCTSAKWINCQVACANKTKRKFFFN